jgi:preprotein translocase subunit SecA
MIAKTTELKEQISSGKRKLDDVLPEAFAMVREAGDRTMKMRHFDVQLMGGYVLHQGKIAEMSTGEGKTLVATLPCYLNALEGKGVFVVTVNDYLAKRDRDWMAPIYEYLGLKVGAIQQWMSPEDRKAEYASDITYGTNSEFGFDYLRDNMKFRADDQVQKHLHYAIVDEVDSILIDEARTPLIISGPAEQSSERYQIADRVARRLQPGKHFEIKEKEKQCLLSDEGIEMAQKLVGVESFYQGANLDWHHMIETALRAHHLYRIDRDYVVRQSEEDGRPEVVIVDEFTGRMMAGRRWSDGLHQAVEAKEGIKPREENQTLATITYQNYFRLFKKLAGMTGTAMTEAGEFSKIYNLDVISVPTNRKVIRKDSPDLVYRTSQEKWKAIVEEIERVHKTGQPMLVGTTSIEKSELLSGMLQRKGIPHQVLNAKQHEREAQIIAKAGEKGSVTVSTNMAGRGTDIKLGEGVKELGGLYVLGTERHEARRIDNQLRGRSGRQGDPGSTRFFLALEDDLMRIFYSDKTRNLMKVLGMTEGQAIESPMVTRAIEKAQKKVEQRNFEIRKNLLEYDEVMDSQRKVIYRARQDALELNHLKERILEMITKVVDAKVESILGPKGLDPDLPELKQWLHRKFALDVEEDSLRAFTKELLGKQVERHPLARHCIDLAEKKYEEVEARETPANMRRIEQYLLLNVIDHKWKEHLYQMDALKSGVSFRGYAQVDPKTEYKTEGFRMFEELLFSAADQVTDQIFKLHVPTDEEVSAAREAERRREDAQRVFQAATEAGVVQEQAVQLAQAVFQGQLTADDIIAKIQEAKTQFDKMQSEQAARVAQGGGSVDGATAGPSISVGAPEGAGTGRPAPAQRSVPLRAAFDMHKQMERRREAAEQQARASATQGGQAPPPARRSSAKPEVGRNDPCPCGSGRKYKQCHGRGA